MKLKRMKLVVQLFTVLSLVLMLFATSASAAKGKTYENGALTPPPPDSDKYTTVVNNGTSQPGMMSAMTSNQYLVGANNTISNPYPGVGSMYALTTASTSVDSIYVNLKMQRWTGTQWLDIYNAGVAVNYNTSGVSISDSCTVLSGYYYRLVSNHWLYYGSTYESTTVNGAYQLMG